MRYTQSLLPLLAIIGSVCATDVKYRYLGQIPATNPAFVQVQKFDGQEEALLFSSFGMFTSGKVSVIPDFATKFATKNFAQIKPQVISDKFTWPNDISAVPTEVFGAGVNAITVPDGFIPPGHQAGEIYVITTDPSDITKSTGVYQISKQKSTLLSGYFYHTGAWVDVNQDGRLDFLTARTTGGAGAGELVWFEHPEQGLNQVPWADHTLISGPDVMFNLADVKGYDDSFVVFSAEFWNKKLAVYQFEKGTGKLLNQKVIDDQIGSAYSVKYLDIDADGDYELLVNNHESDNSKAGVFIYSVPSNLFTGSYTKKQIASGFVNAWSLTGNMCPGFPYAVYPQTSQEGKETAHILVAGDGDYSVHLMTPDASGNFSRETIKAMGGTVGSLTYYDIDKDGWLEFFVPNYDKNYIDVYQFYDASSQVEQTFLS